MPCYHPLKAFNLGSKNNGKKTIVFKESPDSEPINLPCGHCIGCRLEHARQWAMRCYHEATLHEENTFITLTYNDENLPKNGSVVYDDLRLFIGRLREHVRYHNDIKIRYFACSEYGDKGDRPHYHALIFGYDFPDKQAWKQQKDGTTRYYLSETLDKLWGKGFTLIAPVTYETSQYVAQYVVKKVKGKLTGYANKIIQVIDITTGEIKTLYLKPYDRYNPLTGDVWQVESEKTYMSRRPGIAKEWFTKYYTDMYPKDFVTINGKEQKSARYYDKLMENISPEIMQSVKDKRQEYAITHQEQYTKARLEQKERVKKARLEKFYQRNLKEKG